MITGIAPRSRRLVLALMCSGMMLVLLDVTAVNVAVPSIRVSLATGVAGVQLAVTAFTVALASTLLIGGSLGDRYGHRRLVLLGLVVFGLASVGCALAPAVSWLVLARAVQGVGAAAVLPSSMAIITRLFPEPGEQARALGIWAGVSSLALPAGPVLGGVLVERLGWAGIFWLNVPVTGLLLLGTAWAAPAELSARTPHQGRLDVGGAILSAAVLGSAVTMIILGGRGSWPPAACLLAVAVAACSMLIMIERRASHPVLPALLLRTAGFVRANAMALGMNLSANGTLFVVTLYFQSVRGIPPLPAGLLLLPVFAPLAIASPLVGRMVARWGHRLPLTIGAGAAVIGEMGLWSAGPGRPSVLVELSLLVLGIGISLFTAPVVSRALSRAPAEYAGAAGGLNNTARQLGTALGVASFGALAGSPDHAASFVTRLHVVAAVAAAIWVVNLVGAMGTDGRADVRAEIAAG